MFENRTLSLIERGLDASSLRHQVLSNNIANVNTPGFKRTDVDFSHALGTAMQRGVVNQTHSGHLPGTSGANNGMTLVREDSSARLDGNNVDIEAEMVNVAENSLYYSALVKQLSDRFIRLRTAITEGRR